MVIIHGEHIYTTKAITRPIHPSLPQHTHTRTNTRRHMHACMPTHTHTLSPVADLIKDVGVLITGKAKYYSVQRVPQNFNYCMTWCHLGVSLCIARKYQQDCQNRWRNLMGYFWLVWDTDLFKLVTVVCIATVKNIGLVSSSSWEKFSSTLAEPQGIGCTIYFSELTSSLSLT